MASATTKTTVIVPAVKETTVTLTLTTDEAKTLRAILGHVGGTPSGYRGDADAVLTALTGTEFEDPFFDQSRDDAIRDNGHRPAIGRAIYFSSHRA